MLLLPQSRSMTLVHSEDFSPSQIGVHSTLGCAHLLEQLRPLVMVPAVLGHVGPHAGCDVVIEGPDQLDLHTLAAHDLHRGR
jgi:hypothetical protein